MDIFPNGLPALPRDLIQAQAAARKHRGILLGLLDNPDGKVPAAPELFEEQNRKRLYDWLLFVGVDWRALVSHVKEVCSILHPASAFGEAAEPDMVERYRLGGPCALSDGELAELVCNANQPIQLHETIYGDDRLLNDNDLDDGGVSEFWMDVIDRVAHLHAGTTY